MKLILGRLEDKHIKNYIYMVKNTICHKQNQVENHEQTVDKCLQHKTGG